MKGVVLVCVIVFSIVSAEPPKHRSSRLNFARQEAAPGSNAEPTTQASASYPAAQGGPYPPSGWKPAGQAFTLPARQQSTPPSQEYGTPAPTYGAPTTTELPGEETTTLESDAENVDVEGSDQSGRFTKSEKQTATPVQASAFYILVPDGQAQKLVLAPAAVPNQEVQYFAKIQTPPAFSSGFVYTPQYTPQYIQVY